MEQEAWEPVEPGDLKIGDYLRIDHRWFDHPFERRFFRISTDKELGIIRDKQLTRMFVDRARAEEGPGDAAAAAAAAQTAAPAADATAAPAEGSPPAEVAEPPETLVIIDPAAEAARETKLRAEQRTALEGAKARDRHTRERALQTLSMLSAGNQDSAVAVAGFVDFLVAILNNSTSPLAPMSPTAPRHSTVRLALLGSDAVWLAGLIGKRMGLSKPELRALAHAALAHAVGLTRMPPHMHEEEPGIALRGTPLADYPSYSAMILEQCGGFDADVLRIVSEHRERPDGTGLPKALQGDRIHPHALIIGAVRELQIRCAGNAVAPGVALAGIYKSLRESHGAVIANHLASAVLLIPVGTYVQLSDGSVARVQKLNEAAKLSPVVESFGPNAELRSGQTIDLSQRPNLFIVRALDTSKLPPKMFDTVRDMGANTQPPEPAKDLPTVEAPSAATETASATEGAATESAAAAPAQASGA